jgi:hypothetical protein
MANRLSLMAVILGCMLVPLWMSISNHRLLAFDGAHVTFRWKDCARGNTCRTMTLGGRVDLAVVGEPSCINRRRRQAIEKISVLSQWARLRSSGRALT